MDIFQAIKDRDINAVRDIIESDPSAIQYKYNGLTPLSLASECCRSIEIIELLLDKGFDPNEYSAEIVPLIGALVGLEHASGSEIAIQEEIISLLLSRGASVHGFPGITAPIYTAIYQGHRRIVEMMLPYWGDINSRRDPDWCTLLHRAAYALQPDIVKLLLENGADVSAHDQNFHSPAMYAIQGSHNIPHDDSDICDPIFRRWREVSELLTDAKKYPEKYKLSSKNNTGGYTCTSIMFACMVLMSILLWIILR